MWGFGGDCCCWCGDCDWDSGLCRAGGSFSWDMSGYRDVMFFDCVVWGKKGKNEGNGEKSEYRRVSDRTAYLWRAKVYKKCLRRWLLWLCWWGRSNWHILNNSVPKSDEYQSR